MGYHLPESASAQPDLSAKNRVWGFFGKSVSANLKTRRPALEPHRGNYGGPRRTASGIPLWPSRDPIGTRGGLNLYGFVGNDGVENFDLLGLKNCWQTSFKWTKDPEPVSIDVDFGNIGEGAMLATKMTITWEGEAEVECCCEGGKPFTGSGVLKGTVGQGIEGSLIMVSGGSPMPSIAAPSPSALGDAISDIIGDFAGGLGAIPGVDKNEIRNASQELAQIYENLKHSIPNNFKWKDGWPCEE